MRKLRIVNAKIIITENYSKPPHSNIIPRRTNIYSYMKIIITENQYEQLFKDLPVLLKRRITRKDLEYLDKEIILNMRYIPIYNDFEDYINSILTNLVHEFVLHEKYDEIETEHDPEYGEVYVDLSRNRAMEIYWKIIPFLEKRYKDMILKSWEKRKSMG
jgi:hypothetical protein